MLFAQQPHIETHTQKSNEWYTSARYIEAARAVMGSIDTDPASCELANRTIQATTYYSKEDSGLAHDWYGNVWLNPPFLKIENKSGIALFVNKLVCEYRCGHVSQAVLLATSDCDASWFHQLWDYPICFPDHNVYFDRPVGLYERVEKEARHGHWFGTVFVYLGKHEQTFIDIFSQFGTIARRVSAQRQSCVTSQELWEGGAL